MTKEQKKEFLQYLENLKSLQTEEYMTEGFELAISALKGGWIPVTERLPEAYKTVIRSNRTISWNGSVNEYVDIGTIDPTDHFVIAWQPLPEPYKKGE